MLLPSVLLPLALFWERLQVPMGSTRMKKLERATAGRSVFRDEALLCRRHDALVTALGEERARSLLLRAPLLLTHDLESTLPIKLEQLGELFPGTDLGSLLLRAPTLLQLNATTTIRPRLLALQEDLQLGSFAGTVQVVARAPTLLQLSDVKARLQALREALPSLSDSDAAALVSRCPSLLAYSSSRIAAKVGALTELLQLKDEKAVARVVKREPSLLTFDVERTLSAKVAAFEERLHGLDARKLLASVPRLLTIKVEESLPRKLRQLEELLPGVDVVKLVGRAPLLLEYKIDSLAPRLEELRALFTEPRPEPKLALQRETSAPPSKSAQRIVASKLLASRAAKSQRGANAAKRSARTASAGALGAAALARRVSAAEGRARGASTVAMLRLAMLDQTVVRERVERLSALLPSEHVYDVVSRQPGLLRRDVEGSLKPRMLFLARELGNASAAHASVVSNPRLLLSSWGVMGRLSFVRECVSGGLGELSPGLAIMSSKKDFGERFPEYRRWMLRRLESEGVEASGAKASPKGADQDDLAALEVAHGTIVEASVESF